MAVSREWLEQTRQRNRSQLGLGDLQTASPEESLNKKRKLYLAGVIVGGILYLIYSKPKRGGRR